MLLFFFPSTLRVRACRAPVLSTYRFTFSPSYLLNFLTFLPSYLLILLPSSLLTFLPSYLRSLRTPTYLLTFLPSYPLTSLTFLPSYLPTFLSSYLLPFLPSYLRSLRTPGGRFTSLTPLLATGSECLGNPRASSGPTFFDVNFYIDFGCHFGDLLAPKIGAQSEPKYLKKQLKINPKSSTQKKHEIDPPKHKNNKASSH
jgi:hypothetical protein